MDVWILSLNADGDGAPYFPHDFSHKHGVVFADRRTAEKQLETLAAEMFGTTGRRVIDKDNQVVIQGFRDGFGGAEYGSWVMIESHGVWGAAEPPLTFKASDGERPEITVTDTKPLDTFPAPWASRSEERETYRFKKAPDGDGVGVGVFRVSDGKELGVVTTSYRYGQSSFTFEGAPRSYTRRKEAAAMLDALCRAREEAEGYKPGDQIAWALGSGSISGVRLSVLTSISGDDFFLYGRAEPVTMAQLAYAKFAGRWTLPKYEG